MAEGDIGTRKLVLLIDSVDWSDSVKKVALRTAKSGSDWLSFPMAAAGTPMDWFLALTLKQNISAGSLLRKLLDTAGAELAYEVWPNGKPVDGTPTAAQPKASGTVVLALPEGDVVGGEANTSTSARFTTEVELKTLAAPTILPAV